MNNGNTAQLEDLIIRMRKGDVAAQEELVNSAYQRLLYLTRKMLKSYPQVARWEQTDDVFQNAVIRLYKSLNKIEIKSAKHFLNLAAMNIRRELIDLARHQYGPMGEGAHHDTAADRKESPIDIEPQTTMDPNKLAQWSEFHRHADELPAEEKEVFNLIWYHDVPQDEAAKLLNISKRTLERRWQSARLMLHKSLKGNLPE